jgi:hypothetical protein
MPFANELLQQPDLTRGSNSRDAKVVDSHSPRDVTLDLRTASVPSQGV